MLKMDALLCTTAECDWTDDEVLFDTEDEDLIDGRPPCGACGAATKRNYQTFTYATKDDRMEAFQHDGQTINTRSGFKRLKADVEARHPGKTLHVNVQSAGADRAARDDRRHALWSQRKARGIDPAMVKKWDAAKKAGDSTAINNSLVDLAAGKQKPRPRLADRARVAVSGPAHTKPSP